MITKTQAMTANSFESVTHKNADGSPMRYRRNGRTKTWKTRPEEFYAANKGHILCNAPNAHYWIGTNKRFTAPDQTQENKVQS
jgi:hypothetical protein